MFLQTLGKPQIIFLSSFRPPPLPQLVFTCIFISEEKGKTSQKTQRPPLDHLKASCDPVAAPQPPASAHVAPRVPPNFSRPLSSGGRAGKGCGGKQPLPSHAPSPTSSGFLLSVSCLLRSPSCKIGSRFNAAEPCGGSWRWMDGGEHLLPTNYTSPTCITSGCEIGGKYFSASQLRHAPSFGAIPGRARFYGLTRSYIQPKSLPGPCLQLRRSCLGLSGSWGLPAPKKTSPQAWGRLGTSLARPEQTSAPVAVAGGVARHHPATPSSWFN